MIFKKIFNKIFKSNTNDNQKPKNNKEIYAKVRYPEQKDENYYHSELNNDNFKINVGKKNINTILEKETNDEKEEIKSQIEDSFFVDEKISFRNIDVPEIKTDGKSKYKYNSKELFVEEVALEYYENKYYTCLFTENHYWWFIYALLFWDIIFMKTDTCTEVPMNHPDFDKLYNFTVNINGMPMDFFKETFYESRKKAIKNRLDELKIINLTNEIETSYKRHYGKTCRPIEDWNKYSLNELLLATNYASNEQIVVVMQRLIENFNENRRGLPDLTLFYNMQTFFVEVKSKNDTLSPEQIQWHEYLVKKANMPVIIFVVNKSDRQIRNLYKKYNPELIEEGIITNINTNNNPKQHHSFIPDGLIEVEYKVFSNSRKSLKAMDNYLDIVLYYEDTAKDLEQTSPEQAIAIYEKLVYEYKFGGNFPYNRLLVLYRKQDRYEDMINVCDAAITNLGNNEYLIGKELMLKKNSERVDVDKKIKRFKDTRTKTEILLKNKPMENKIKIAKELEKENKIDDAIEKYEEVINEKYPKKLPYNRLCILYRKKKNYTKELEICDKAIEVLNDKESKWFEERRIKVHEKIKK